VTGQGLSPKSIGGESCTRAIIFALQALDAPALGGQVVVLQDGSVQKTLLAVPVEALTEPSSARRAQEYEELLRHTAALVGVPGAKPPTDSPPPFRVGGLLPQEKPAEATITAIQRVLERWVASCAKADAWSWHLPILVNADDALRFAVPAGTTLLVRGVYARPVL
jgi:hypothetical protein